MRLFDKVGAYSRTFIRGRRNRADLVRYLGRRPALLAANVTYETALLVSSRLDTRVKVLADIKVAGLIGCPF